MSLLSFNPATGEKIREYHELTPAQVAGAVRHSQAAFMDWRQASFAARSRHLRAAGAALRARQDALARLVTDEMGKPIGQSRAEIEKCALVCDYYAQHAETFLAAERSAGAPAGSRVVFQPLGIVLAIMPWNFPFWQTFRAAAPALMAGNAVLLKHASNVSGCALAIQKVFDESGLPRHTFQTLLIGANQIAALIKHPHVSAVTMTGSTAGGKQVAALAGAEMKKGVFELGGSDPYLILEDADLAKAAEICAHSRLINTGQSCVSAKRFIVVEAVRAEFERLFVGRMAARRQGPPADPIYDLGPLARQDLREQLHAQVNKSVRLGAQVLLGGKLPAGPGWFYPATVLAQVARGMPAYEEEMFGPVAPLIAVQDEDEAIAVANDTPYGLGAAVFTGKPRARRADRRDPARSRPGVRQRIRALLVRTALRRGQTVRLRTRTRLVRPPRIRQRQNGVRRLRLSAPGKTPGGVVARVTKMSRATSDSFQSTPPLRWHFRFLPSAAMPKRSVARKISRSRAPSPPAREPPPARPAKAAYFNRELSWLAFNRRVLEQAQNSSHPLLERVKFLAIVSSNLDEFFEIRVAGLIQQVDSGLTEPSIDGLGPREQLRRIHSVVGSLVDDQYRCWQEQLKPALARAGILFKTANQLSAPELAWVRTYFQEQVYPVLTPLAVDQTHPFPQLGNKTLNVVVSLDDPEAPADEERMAILPVPRILPRLVHVRPSRRGPQCYIFLSEIVKLCAGALFPGYRINGAQAFRVTRNSDLYIDDEESENLLKKIEEELRNLRRGAAVRLEIEEGVEDRLFNTLCTHLGLSHEYVFRLAGPLNLMRLTSFYDVINRPELKFPAFTPANDSPLREPEKIFAVLRAQDVLLHHPYDAFTPVVDFVAQAARDPQVFALKQTLYRTSGDSPVVRALIDASRNGKQVTALIELKARFDEANNIQWARQLEEAGVHVVYGLVGHKIHCKCSLVVRREGRRLRHYAHLGTGNYNPRTARLYTDLSLFTSRAALTGEVAAMFNTLTGFGRPPKFHHLLVAPFNLHAEIQELIQRETARAAAGRPARILAKMNNLVDKTTIDHLYAASCAGVMIDLIVRGTCCLVPGVRGLSENIRVRSLVGRFLEHARAFYFENHGGDSVILCGSADWMPRNFFRRVEVLYPIVEPALRQRIIERIFPAELRDNTDARILRPNGAYLPVPRQPSDTGFSAQDYFATKDTWR